MNKLAQMSNRREEIVVFCAKALIFGIVTTVIIALGAVMFIASAILINN